MMFMNCSSIHMCELKYIGSFIYMANGGHHDRINRLTRKKNVV